MHLLRVCVCTLSCVQLLATPWTLDLQASLSLEFSRQDFWSGFLFLFPIRLTCFYLQNVKEVPHKIMAE